MLGKKVAKIFKENGFDTLRAYELNVHHLQNGDLHRFATNQRRVLVSCDSDFDINKIGKLGSMSIIYLKPEPDSSLKYLLPLLRLQIEKLPTDNVNDHLIVITNVGIEISKFVE
ncbi:MAG: DUF5615 family PIN-like protein [Candidatus Kariarchaeaceae archaeon]|jgi:predicted nuclease of predicted toxin-antitoxin system